MVILNGILCRHSFALELDFISISTWFCPVGIFVVRTVGQERWSLKHIHQRAVHSCGSFLSFSSAKTAVGKVFVFLWNIYLSVKFHQVPLATKARAWAPELLLMKHFPFAQSVPRMSRHLTMRQLQRGAQHEVTSLGSTAQHCYFSLSFSLSLSFLSLHVRFDFVPTMPLEANCALKLAWSK